MVPLQGRQPHLAWHMEKKGDFSEMPILTISPVYKLREGPDFAFGARWCLIQYHPWTSRRQFFDKSDDEIEEYFKEWILQKDCPWYVVEDYFKENKSKTQLLRAKRRNANKRENNVDKGEEGSSEDNASEACDDIVLSSSGESNVDMGEDKNVLKCLYRGHVEEKNRRQEQQGKFSFKNPKHDYYLQTRCSAVALEEASAFPGGCLNIHEDTDAEEGYAVEDKEVEKEMQELVPVQNLVNIRGGGAYEQGVVREGARDILLKLPCWTSVRKKLEEGDLEDMDGKKVVMNEEEVFKKYPLDILDPTQRCFVDRVLRWAAEVVDAYKEYKDNKKKFKPPRLRAWLGGSAGSGKSTTLKTCVAHIRLLFQQEKVDATIALTAYTGVAAFNMSFGAKTASRSFQIYPKQPFKKELKGRPLAQLEAQWQHVVLLIIDEISFIGTAFLHKMHLRMQQGKRPFFSEHGQDPKDHTFGGVSILLVGDFGQLDPIDDLSLADRTMRAADASKAVKGQFFHVRLGRALVRTFQEAYLLKRVHRSECDMWWTESCLRLRDFTCSYENDYLQWRLHDLDHGHLNDEQKKYFEDEAVWLCARTEDVGTRNGRKLAYMAKNEGVMIHRIKAINSHNTQKNASSGSYDGLRPVINIARGCKVLLTKNIATRYGLSNGTRGIVIGVVYGKGGIGSFPEAIVIEAPGYCGPQFYDGHPKWIPILPQTVTKVNSNYTRTQFPLVCCFAMTINKSQGLTLQEGVVINLNGSRTFRPASKHGLPFVAFTRSESFAMTAFKNLPPWEDFTRGKESDMLYVRQEFEKELEVMHEKTWKKHAEGNEQQQHAKWQPKRRTCNVEAGPKFCCPACVDNGW